MVAVIEPAEEAGRFGSTILNAVLLVCLREQVDQRRPSTELVWTRPQEEYRAVWPSSLMLVLPESGEQRAERALKLEATVGLDMQDGSGLQRYDVLPCIQAHINTYNTWDSVCASFFGRMPVFA